MLPFFVVPLFLAQHLLMLGQARNIAPPTPEKRPVGEGALAV
jgi:hypothetical protein